MERVCTFLYKATCAVMIFLFGCIFVQTTGNLSHMELSGAFLSGPWKYLLITGGALTLLMAIRKLTVLLLGLSSKSRTIILTGLFCIGLSLQLLLIFGLRPCLQYDSLKPVDTAIAMLKGIPLAATQYYDYFSIYPHNVPLTLYIMCIFKIAGFLGVSEGNYIVLLQFINCLLLDFALLQMGRLLQRHFGLRQSLSFSLLCFLNPLLYYYPIFFYTQVLSIPIFVLLITVFYQLLEARDIKGRLFYGLCYGIVLFFAWKIRFFTLITLIACGMFLIFRKKRNLPSPKMLVAAALSMLIGFFVCAFINDALMTKYSIHTEESQAFPVQHWIMMGLQGDGTFYYGDEDFTSAFPTKDSRIEEDTKVIKERLKALGPLGLVRLWGRKMAITWSDGYDDYAANLTLTENYGVLNDFLSGYRCELIAACLHIYNCMSWLLVFICAIFLFLKNHSSSIYTICITIVGGVLFHFIWEAGEPYSMPFALLIVAAACAGLNTLSLPRIRNRISREKIGRVRFLAPALFLLTILHLLSPLSSTSFDVTEIAAIQNLVGGDYLFLENGDTLTQTVQVSREFNTVTLRYKYYEEKKGDVQALFRLYDEDGNCLCEQTMPLADAVTLIDFELPGIRPQGTETYTMELTALHIPEGSRIGVTAYHTQNWDAYANGTASRNEIPIEKTDIYFELTNKCAKTLL